MVFRKLGDGRRRSGAAAIETAFVLIPTLLFLMGVLEYGRLLMDWNVINNAAREGCRFALANNTDATLATDVQNTVTTRMGSEINSFTSFSVTVSGVHQGTTYTGNNVNNLVAGDLITVTVTGTYKFMNVIPYHKMPTLTLTTSVTMVCEGAS
jgi:Flp pilus assembly protein TadG